MRLVGDGMKRITPAHIRQLATGIENMDAGHGGDSFRPTHIQIGTDHPTLRPGEAVAVVRGVVEGGHSDGEEAAWLMVLLP